MRATYWRIGIDQLDWLQPRVVTPATLPAGAESAELVDLSGPSNEVHLWSTLSVLNFGKQRAAPGGGLVPRCCDLAEGALR